MTRINIIKFSNGYRIEVLGHSGYAEKGKDIVCASISTLVQYMEMCFAKTCEHNLEKYEDGAFISNIKFVDYIVDEFGNKFIDYGSVWKGVSLNLILNFKEFVKELQEQYPEYVMVKELKEDKELCLTK